MGPGRHYARAQDLTRSQSAKRLYDLARAARLELDAEMESDSAKDIVATNIAIKVLVALGRFDRKMKRGTLI